MKKAPGGIPGQLINFNGGHTIVCTPIRIIFKHKSTSSQSLFTHLIKKKMKQKKVSMKIVNTHCAGIDVGSRSHYVAIGQMDSEVREFGVYAQDLRALCDWLTSNGINSAAMESTGSYWQNLYVELINSGIQVVLTSGRFTKNMNRKKTDVRDCQWIQKLHSLALLPSSFLPDSSTEKLRTLCRHRANMIDLKADASHKMQKFLKLLNFRLDVVVRDVTGLTGLKIIEDICKGILNPEELSKNRHYNCRKSQNEIAKALVSNERDDYIFGLNQEFERHQFYLQQIEKCDQKITEFLNQLLKSSTPKEPEEKSYKRNNKNSINGMDLNKVAFQYFHGVDLYLIPGVSHSTILSIMSEIGPEGFEKFPSAKHFASWLRLAPNNKISGGKTLTNRIPKGSSRLKIALRNAANAVGNLKESDLGRFFTKTAFKKGRQAAITATARKIAVILWNMITKNEQYHPKTTYIFLDEKRKQLALIRKKIAKFGLDPNELGIFSQERHRQKWNLKQANIQTVN
jgi:transposase